MAVMTSEGKRHRSRQLICPQDKGLAQVNTVLLFCTKMRSEVKTNKCFEVYCDVCGQRLPFWQFVEGVCELF